jgi:hypothetical protein
MCEISCVLEAEDPVDYEDPKVLSVSNIVCCEYARLVACDVERIFSRYKLSFRDNGGHRFTVHNWNVALMVHYNSVSFATITRNWKFDFLELIFYFKSSQNINILNF